jgi:hypothetical protein
MFIASTPNGPQLASGRRELLNFAVIAGTFVAETLDRTGASDAIFRDLPAKEV